MPALADYAVGMRKLSNPTEKVQEGKRPGECAAPAEVRNDHAIKIQTRQRELALVFNQAALVV